MTRRMIILGVMCIVSLGPLAPQLGDQGDLETPVTQEKT